MKDNTFNIMMLFIFYCLVAASVVAKEDHRFEGSPLQVEYIKLSGDQNGAQEGGATLEVSNIPLNMKEDYLRMYFENPKSGGCADCVEDVAVIEPGIAHVQLIDATSKLSMNLIKL